MKNPKVIKIRFGKPTHILLMIFAIVANILIMSSVCKEGMTIISSQTTGNKRHHLKKFFCINYFSMSDFPAIAVAIVISIVAVLISIFGGMGGTFYVAYFSVVLFFIMQFILYTNLYFDTLNKNNFPLAGNRESNDANINDLHISINYIFFPLKEIYNATNVLKVPLNVSDNRECSYLTFITPDAVYAGVVEILSKLYAKKKYQGVIRSKKKKNLYMLHIQYINIKNTYFFTLYSWNNSNFR